MKNAKPVNTCLLCLLCVAMALTLASCQLPSGLFGGSRDAGARVEPGTPAGHDSSGVHIVHRTPDEFCSGTARSIAIERYDMKRRGVSVRSALEQNGGVALVDVITRAVYGRDLKSEAQAADAGTAACLGYFR